MEVPAQTTLDARPLYDQVVAMIDEQPEISGCAIQLRDREVRFAECGPGNRQGIDGIRFAPFSPAATRTGHKLGRHAQDRFASPKQITFEAASHVSTVLKGKLTHRPAHCPFQRL